MFGEPLFEPIPEGLDPEVVFRKLSGRPGLFFLDSSARSTDQGRWSILGADPYAVLSSASAPEAAPDAWARLERTLRARARPPRTVPGPFGGGAVGYLSYDLGRRFERIPDTAADPLATPEFRLGLYDRFVVFDRDSGEGWLVSTGDPAEGFAARRRAEDRLVGLRELLAQGRAPARAPFS
ncbi:MAG: aminodeoxychorismate synthase, component I, partial [Candidatus Eisenbacteria bacterium]|nr:aminodeoxychorismate synthase, component I [Candidatus Latescibacterota bacterium]MBD3301114.1 aminodeoxychorismate synthase, component I [Candidatus Eisenbacteria bacterium]